MPLSKIDSASLNTPITAVDLAYTGTLTGNGGIVNIGSGQIYKDASGNVGIGETAPASYGKLTVTGSSAVDGINTWVRNTSDVSGDNVKYAGIQFSVGSDNGSTAIRSYRTNSSIDYSSALAFFTKGNNAGPTVPTERMRIDSSGNLLVGTTANSPGARILSLVANGGNGISVTNTSGTAQYNAMTFYVNGTTFTNTGAISVSGSTTAYNTSSDYRLKNTIAPMTGALDKVALLKPVTYKWNADGSDGQGFIAHELQEVEPGCVTGEKDAVDAEGKPQYQGIDTSFLVATLTAAIQEQQVIIAALTTRITALEAK